MNDTAPLISIITINLNNKEGLVKTLESVRSQVFTDYELIVIDGGSQDGSKEIIQTYESGISCWMSEKDKGIYHAMNKGILRAKGRYCYFLNSGDYLADPQAFHRMAPFLNTETIIYGNVLLEKDHRRTESKGFASDRISLFDFYTGTIFHISAFIRRSRFLEDTLYDETLKISSDWAWFVHTVVRCQCPVRYVDALVGVYDLTGISSVNYLLAQEERKAYIRKLYGQPVLEDYMLFSDINYKYGRLWRNRFTRMILHYLNACLYRIEKRTDNNR